jgi:hypothetical protein
MEQITTKKTRKKSISGTNYDYRVNDKLGCGRNKNYKKN